jgi:hypothetical protein
MPGATRSITSGKTMEFSAQESAPTLQPTSEQIDHFACEPAHQPLDGTWLPFALFCLLEALNNYCS